MAVGTWAKRSGVDVNVGVAVGGGGVGVSVAVGVVGSNGLTIAGVVAMASKMRMARGNKKVLRNKTRSKQRV